MSPALENLVRPFQSPDFVPGRLTVGRPQTPPDTVIMFCGGQEGQISSLQGSRSSSITAYTEGQHSEVARTVVPTRVKNPDDPDQHVDVDVVTSLTMVSKNGDKVDKAEQKFTGPNQYNQGVEILGPPKKEGDPKGWHTDFGGGV